MYSNQFTPFRPVRSCYISSISIYLAAICKNILTSCQIFGTILRTSKIFHMQKHISTVLDMLTESLFEQIELFHKSFIRKIKFYQNNQ